MRPGVLCLVALCGPLTNGLLACLSAALGWWGALPGEIVCLAVFTNLCLMAFNLLPALPLDGGRILCALLPPAAREGRAMGRAAGAGAGRPADRHGLRDGRAWPVQPDADPVRRVSAAQRSGRDAARNQCGRAVAHGP